MAFQEFLCGVATAFPGEPAVRAEVGESEFFDGAAVSIASLFGAGAGVGSVDGDDAATTKPVEVVDGRAHPGDVVHLKARDRGSGRDEGDDAAAAQVEAHGQFRGDVGQQGADRRVLGDGIDRFQAALEGERVDAQLGVGSFEG